MPFAVQNTPYLGLAELVARWNSSRATLDRWRKQGIPGTSMKLHAVKLGRRVMFPRTSVEQIELALELAGQPAVRPVRRRRRRAA